jgi:hypothetical protein
VKRLIGGWPEGCRKILPNASRKKFDPKGNNKK